MPYETEKTFDWLINPNTNHKLFVDIFFPKLNLAIEIDGEQHYKFLPYFHKNEEEFLYNVNRDRIKDRLLKENGVDIIRIRKDSNYNLYDIFKKYTN